ncbi:NAD(P)H-dependent oxidoreductase [Halorussus gelatinilyticus]|uniref:NAD(P)H-dependent oxidoreductase n=1 Tax=Halorussus gelatinilyticus TaxID=2937524 RepID=A0A8U0IK10_9EURY|nr:NAD(P)H-dependent oxidoreductase [Halorussus gelatinilyticus]UPW00642.1 NAD(P)H-dependent oxidoreductase [Halorussus gelatinilyticus]
MPDTPHVVAICGSLRDESVTRVALETAIETVEDEGGEAELLDLREYDLPAYDPDTDDADAGDADRLKREVRAADAILLGSPMYHGSYSSVLKTAIDYCGFDEFEHKTVGLLAVSGGSFPITALEHLRSVCRALDAWVLPHQAAVPRSHSAVRDGTFTDETVAERVRELGREVVHYANIEPAPPTMESEENVGAVD